MTIIEERGLFWWNNQRIPESQYAPEGSVSGSLKVEDDGEIRLDLDGTLPSARGPLARLIRRSDDVRNIQGILKGTNDHVLLVRVVQSGGTMRTNGISSEQFVARDCLVGSSTFRKDGEPVQRYRSTRAKLVGYEGWLQMDSIAVSRRKSALSAKYSKPKDFSYDIAEGKLSIEFGLSAPWPGQSKHHKLDITELAYLRFTPREAVPLDQCIEQYQLLQDFLILLTDSDYCLDWPSLISADGKKKCRLYFLTNRGSSPAPSRHECFINFPQIRGELGQLFSTWQQMRERFGPAFYLYLGTRRGMKLFVEHRFMNMIWGLEAFDRRKFGEAEPTIALKDKIDRVVGSVSIPRDKKWLVRQLRLCAEPSLEQRLHRIFIELRLPLDRKALLQFCRECAEIRNDISHFGGNRQRAGDYSAFMRHLEKRSNALAALYHILILREIGVPSHLLDLQARGNWRIANMQRSLREAGLWQGRGA
jgi:hypothetical protein